MNAEPSFRNLANMVLHDDPALAGMRTIVEKELLHYELLDILERGGWLNGLVFQGGTALRLCYGALRLSEDLDFSGGPDFSPRRMTGLAAALEKDLAARGLNAAVKSPKRIADHRHSGGVGVSTWRIDIETQPGRRNMPKQKIKLDVDNATSRTRELHEVARNYDVLYDLGTLVHVQGREEILAGKLVAFSSSVVNRNRPRHRDIWDIRWLMGNGVKLRADLVRAKAQDQRIPQAWMKIASERAVAIVRSPEFSAEMRRFLPPTVSRRSLDNPQFMEFLASETKRIVLTAAKCLPGEEPQYWAGGSREGEAKPDSDADDPFAPPDPFGPPSPHG